MKNIFKYMGISLLTVFLATSCEDPTVGDDEAADFNNGISVVQFTSSKANAPAVADGEEKMYDVRVQLAGPDIENLTEDVVVNFSVDPSSTAVAGTNFRFDVTTVTLTKANNYLATLPVTILTEGVTPPFSPTLVLNIDSVTSNNDDVVVSGNKGQIVVSLAYLCFADLNGSYVFTNDITVRNCNLPATTTIAANSEGGWEIALYADGGVLQYCSGNDGFDQTGSILVVCGEVFVQNQVQFCGSNGIGCIVGGSWDPDEGNGVLRMQHEDTFFPGVGSFNSTYTRQ